MSYEKTCDFVWTPWEYWENNKQINLFEALWPKRTGPRHFRHDLREFIVLQIKTKNQKRRKAEIWFVITMIKSMFTKTVKSFHSNFKYYVWWGCSGINLKRSVVSNAVFPEWKPNCPKPTKTGVCLNIGPSNSMQKDFLIDTQPSFINFNLFPITF